MLTAYQRLMSMGYLTAGLINACIWLALFFFIDHSAEITILHYNIYFGPDGFGEWYRLLWLPGIGLGILIMNLALTPWLWRIDRFLSNVLAGGTIFSQLVLLCAAILLIQMNRV